VVGGEFGKVEYSNVVIAVPLDGKHGGEFLEAGQKVCGHVVFNLGGVNGIRRAEIEGNNAPIVFISRRTHVRNRGANIEIAICMLKINDEQNGIVSWRLGITTIGIYFYQGEGIGVAFASKRETGHCLTPWKLIRDRSKPRL